MKKISDSEAAYLDFWSKAFDLEVEILKNNDVEFVSSGKYVDRNPGGLLYFYFDFQSQKKIFASSDGNLKELKNSLSVDKFQGLNTKNIKEVGYLKRKNQIFNDVDHYLLVSSDYRAMDYSSLKIDEIKEKEQLTSLYEDCSEGDIDTLDLNFDGEYALGLFVSDQLVAVSRYFVIPQTNGIADITVLVGKSHRGNGYSAPLVSKIVDVINENGYCPRYRAKEDNYPSQAIAKKLGFKKTQQIMVWEV